MTTTSLSEPQLRLIWRSGEFQCIRQFAASDERWKVLHRALAARPAAAVRILYSHQ